MRHLLILALCSSVIALADKDTLPIAQKNPSRLDERLLLKPKGAQAPKEETKSQNKKAEEEIVGTAPTEEPQPYIGSIDVFGTSKLNETLLKDFLGKHLDKWLEMGLTNDPKAMEFEAQLADRIKKKFGFALVDWSIIQYFNPGNLAIHITLDVVEEKDMSRRASFTAAPSEEIKDPDSLIQQWLLYENTALDLVDKGELEPESEKCVAFHCPFGHVHKELKRFEKIFVQGVKKNEATLINILARDKRVEYRAAAAYLLAYSKDGKKIIEALMGRVRDPEPLVRNNSLRVLGDIAEFHPELVIPVEPILPALDYPRASDRNKAVYLAYLLAQNSSRVRDTLVAQAVPSLLQVLASRQPDHREFGYELLRKISGKNFSPTDLTAWTNWANRLPKPRESAGK